MLIRLVPSLPLLSHLHSQPLLNFKHYPKTFHSSLPTWLLSLELVTMKYYSFTVCLSCISCPSSSLEYLFHEPEILFYVLLDLSLKRGIWLKKYLLNEYLELPGLYLYDMFCDYQSMIIKTKCWWGCGETDHYYISGENLKWYSHFGKFRQFLIILNMQLSFDSAILSLGIYY